MAYSRGRTSGRRGNRSTNRFASGGYKRPASSSRGRSARRARAVAPQTLRIVVETTPASEGRTMQQLLKGPPPKKPIKARH